MDSELAASLATCDTSAHFLHENRVAGRRTAPPVRRSQARRLTNCRSMGGHIGRSQMLLPSPEWLNSGNNAWQLAASTFVGLQSIPGLVVLYGGIVKKKWAINSA